MEDCTNNPIILPYIAHYKLFEERTKAAIQNNYWIFPAICDNISGSESYQLKHLLYLFSFRGRHIPQNVPASHSFLSGLFPNVLCCGRTADEPAVLLNNQKPLNMGAFTVIYNTKGETL